MTGRTSWRTRHMYRTPEPPMPDRNELTPITALASREVLERVVHDVHEHDGELGSLAAEVAQTKKVALATAEAVAAHLREEQRRPRMSPGAIKAWGISTAAVLTVLVTGITQWRVAQAGAESRQGAEVAAAQSYTRQAEVDRQKLAEVTASVAARRAADEVRRAIHEEQAEAERRALMRVPKR